MTVKRCTRCGMEKPLTSFRSRTGREKRRHSWCYDCKHAYDRKRMLMRHRGLEQVAAAKGNPTRSPPRPH